MSRVSARNIWYESDVPVFLERFPLVVCVGIFLAFVINNGMQLDTFQRIALGMILVGTAYLIASAVHKTKRPSEQPTAATRPEDHPIRPPSLPPAPPTEKPKAQLPNEPSPHPTVRVETPTLPVMKLRFTQEIVSSKREDAPFAVKAIIQTNVPIQPTSLALKCDAEIIDGDFSVTGVGSYRSSGTGYVNGHDGQPDKEIFWIFFGDPQFKPETPISVTLMAKTPIHVLSVQEGPSPPLR